MACDEALAARIRALLSDHDAVVERRMFGGIGFLVHGHLAVGASSQAGLIVRCAREDFAARCAEPGAEPMLRGSTPMTGWVHVHGEAVVDDAALEVQIARGLTYAESLPPK